MVTRGMDHSPLITENIPAKLIVMLDRNHAAQQHLAAVTSLAAAPDKQDRVPDWFVCELPDPETWYTLGKQYITLQHIRTGIRLRRHLVTPSHRGGFSLYCEICLQGPVCAEYNFLLGIGVDSRTFDPPKFVSMYAPVCRHCLNGLSALDDVESNISVADMEKLTAEFRETVENLRKGI